jgi:hypothetical protein
VSIIACGWDRSEFWGHRQWDAHTIPAVAPPRELETAARGGGSDGEASHAREKMVGLGRVELPTRSLGNCCSIHLSYRPERDALILYPKSEIATKFSVGRCGACRHGGAVPAVETPAKKFVQMHEFSEKCSEATSRCYPNARRDGLRDAGASRFGASRIVGSPAPKCLGREIRSDDAVPGSRRESDAVAPVNSPRAALSVSETIGLPSASYRRGRFNRAIAGRPSKSRPLDCWRLIT